MGEGTGVDPGWRPFVVGIGGTTRPGSSSQVALEAALRAAAEKGAEVVQFSGEQLDLPMYRVGGMADAPPVAHELVAALRACDGVVVASPGYHGTVSGLVKNALDYIEEMREDPRVYLAGRAMGCIGVAYGWQAAVGSLHGLRTVAHALRAWPTPCGVAVNSLTSSFDEGGCTDRHVQEQLVLVGQQVVDFARLARR